MSGKENIERIMRAEELITPSIVLTFFEGQSYNDSIFVIDYISEYYDKKSQVIGDYLTYGNSTDRLRAYGNNIKVDINNPGFNAKYYFDLSSYLVDPIKNAPINSRPSIFHEINLDNEENLKDVLYNFYQFLEKQEEDGEMENKIFKYGEFNVPNYITEYLNRCDHLKSFNDVIEDTDFFDKNLF